MGCGAAQSTGLGFVCFVVINPRVLSVNGVDFGIFLFHKFSNLPHPPPQGLQTTVNKDLGFKSLSLLYLSFSTTNLFAPTVVRVIGIKWGKGVWPDGHFFT